MSKSSTSMRIRCRCCGGGGLFAMMRKRMSPLTLSHKTKGSTHQTDRDLDDLDDLDGLDDVDDLDRAILDDLDDLDRAILDDLYDLDRAMLDDLHDLDYLDYLDDLIRSR